ncbi:MFS transporter [Algicola sagamiensis]|uniref:MFS transporter n=1 Tax=Algicola sagamiensis TaxID=163869 RepID=UPI00035D9554|nr:MFS transporter [Algicola sagamiensis]
MSQNGQFQLFKTRRFLPFFFTQAFGALNDNIYKNALMLLVAFSAAASLPLSTNTLMNLAAGLFIFPFFLFSALAGEIADRLNKTRLIQIIKAVEIGIMLSAAGALALESYTLLFLLLFLMGTQSAFFGPVKYAILPELVKNDALVGANGLVEMGTFVSILLGTLIAGVLMGFEDVIRLVGVTVISVSMLGFFCSLFIPSIPSKNEVTKPLRYQPWRQTKKVIGLAYGQRELYLAIMAISWFWFLGASYLTQFPNFAKTNLNGDDSVVTAMLMAFSIGVGVGSLLCERLSGRKVELGIVPLGSIGLTIFGLLLYGVSPIESETTELMSLGGFLTTIYGWGVLINLALIGVFGGIFIVPLYALLQQNASQENRAKVIAANNIFNALFMVGSAVLGIVFLSVFHLAIPEYFAVLAIMNIAVSIYVFTRIPVFTIRFIIWVITHTFYRVRAKGLEHIPDEGAAVLVCNHVSYVDALILAGACRRPIRFIMDKPIYDIWVLTWFFRLAGAIPITSPRYDRECYEQSFVTIKKALENGELVLIFPEGKLTRNGEINSFKPGINRILEETPVPVVPIVLQNLWGSFFSHEGKGAFKPGKRFWSKINIIGEPVIDGHEVRAKTLETKIREMRGDYR